MTELQVSSILHPEENARIAVLTSTLSRQCLMDSSVSRNRRSACQGANRLAGMRAAQRSCSCLARNASATSTRDVATAAMSCNPSRGGRLDQ
jgi:hypothetical protein